MNICAGIQRRMTVLEVNAIAPGWITTPRPGVLHRESWRVRCHLWRNDDAESVRSLLPASLLRTTGRIVVKPS